MGGVLSVPGTGGPAVEDVVALAESVVPYSVPLPVNEVSGLFLLSLFCFLLFQLCCTISSSSDASYLLPIP